MKTIIPQTVDYKCDICNRNFPESQFTAVRNHNDGNRTIYFDRSRLVEYDFHICYNCRRAIASDYNAQYS